MKKHSACKLLIVGLRRKQEKRAIDWGGLWRSVSDPLRRQGTKAELTGKQGPGALSNVGTLLNPMSDPASRGGAANRLMSPVHEMLGNYKAPQRKTRTISVTGEEPQQMAEAPQPVAPMKPLPRRPIMAVKSPRPAPAAAGPQLAKK